MRRAPLLAALCALALPAAGGTLIDQAELDRAMRSLEAITAPARQVQEWGRMLWGTLYEQEWRTCQTELKEEGARPQWRKLAPDGLRWLTASAPGRGFYLCAHDHRIYLGREPDAVSLSEDNKELVILADHAYYARIRARDLGRRDMSRGRSLVPEAWLFVGLSGKADPAFPHGKPARPIGMVLDPKTGLAGYGITWAMKALQDDKLRILDADSPFRRQDVRRAVQEWANERLNLDDGPVLASILMEKTRWVELGRVSEPSTRLAFMDEAALRARVKPPLSTIKNR